MDTNTVRKYCQEYLDGQLDPDLKAQVDAFLAQDEACARYFQDQQNFHRFLKRACMHESAAKDFKDRVSGLIKNGFETASAPVSSSPRQPFTKISSQELVSETEVSPRPIPPKRSWIWPVALAASVILMVGIASTYRNLKCPYLSVCAEAHNLIMSGKSDEVGKADMGQYLQFVKGEVNYDLPALPDLKAYKLKPVGAGCVEYKSLNNASIPKAAYVRYSADGQDPVSLQFHPWANHAPASFTHDSTKNIWSADHDGYRVVCWRTSDGKVLCTAVSQRPMGNLIQIASAARDLLDE